MYIFKDYGPFPPNDLLSASQTAPAHARTHATAERAGLGALARAPRLFCGRHTTRRAPVSSPTLLHKPSRIV